MGADLVESAPTVSYYCRWCPALPRRAAMWSGTSGPWSQVTIRPFWLGTTQPSPSWVVPGGLAVAVEVLLLVLLVMMVLLLLE
ncbi:hypothetical protein JNW90_01175 [Micromonospora sp. STR1s_5]|nr:hypothetical protein [Micromonospora sp. STR1s_5]